MTGDLEAAKDQARLAWREARHDLTLARRRRVDLPELLAAEQAEKRAGEEFTRAWRAWHDDR